MQHQNLVSKSTVFPSDFLIPDVYRQAYPDQLSVLDLWQLSEKDAEFPKLWLESLLGKGPSSLKIEVNPGAAKKINHLYFNSRNGKKLSGYKNLKFGYPLLMLKKRNISKGIMLSPLFLWNVDLEPNALKEDSWRLSFERPSVILNPALNTLSEETDQLIREYSEKLKQSRPDTFLMDDLCSQLSVMLHLQNERPAFGVQGVPNMEEMVSIQESGAILWSGVFSQFQPVQFYSFGDRVLTPDHWQEKQDEKTFKSKLSLNYFSGDHNQEAILRATNRNKFLFVNAIPGVGRSTTVSNLIINGLLNKEKTLVVASHLPVLEKIASRIPDPLSPFLLLIKDLQVDKDNYLNRLVAKTDRVLRSKTTGTLSFKKDYDKFVGFRQQLDQVRNHYSRNIFDIHNWTESVGQFLNRNKIESKGQLDLNLMAADYQFNLLEFEIINQHIDACYNKFQEPFAFSHPLDNLNDTLFITYEKDHLRSSLRKKLQQFISQARELQNEGISFTNNYKDALQGYFSSLSAELQMQCNKILDQVDLMNQELGEEFNKVSIKNLSLAKTFSGKSKKALSQKKKIVQSLNKLQYKQEEKLPFDFQFDDQLQVGNIEKIKEALIDYKLELHQWDKNIPQILNEHLSRLSARNNPELLNKKIRLEELETRFNEFYQLLEESGLYGEPLVNTAITIPLKIQALDDVIEQLNLSLLSVKDLDGYFEWRNQWVEMDDKSRKVISALLKIRPADWKAAFQSWYFNHLLEKEDINIVSFDNDLKNYFRTYETARESVAEFVKKEWADLQSEKLTFFRKKASKKLKDLFNQLESKEQFIDYFNEYPDFFLSFFPVLLTTNVSINELAKPEFSQHFDRLIILSGSNISRDQGGSLLEMAKNVVVFGSELEGLIPQGQSFLDVAKNLAGKFVSLPNYHKNSPQSLPSFIKEYFVPDLRIFKKWTTGASIYHGINGQYDQESDTNAEEAQYILDLLLETKIESNKPVPKVAVTCATVPQRNLIQTLLLKIKRKNDQKSEKIKQLERNGMGVYIFEEIPGQDVDFLIISLTYGIDNVGDFEFPEKQSLFGLPGKHLLFNLINCCYSQFHLCNSIPLNFLKSFKGDDDLPGLFILANLIDQIRSSNSASMNRMAEFSVGKKSNGLDWIQSSEQSFFMEEVQHYLLQYFESDRFEKNVIINGNTYPLIIRAKQPGQDSFVLVGDGLDAETEVFSYHWYQEEIEELEKSGYHYLRLWSRNWWKDPEQESRKLASRIIRVDKRSPAERS